MMEITSRATVDGQQILSKTAIEERQLLASVDIHFQKKIRITGMVNVIVELAGDSRGRIGSDDLY
jgi:hypothetical protein